MQSQAHLSLLLHIQDEEGLLFFFFHQCIHLANLHPFQQSHNLSPHRCHTYGFANNYGKYLHFSSVRCTQENMGSCNSSATQSLNQLRSNTQSLTSTREVQRNSVPWIQATRFHQSVTRATDYPAVRHWLANSQQICKFVSTVSWKKKITLIYVF